MIKGRDSRGHFITGHVPHNKKADSSLSATQRGKHAVTQGRDSKGRFLKGCLPLNTSADSSPPAIGGRTLIGGGVLKHERVQVTCPACGEQVEAIARNGRVKGYCAVANQYVDFQV